MKKLNIDSLQLGGTVDPDSTIFEMTRNELIILRRALTSLEIYNLNLLKIFDCNELTEADQFLIDKWTNENKIIKNLIDVL